MWVILGQNLINFEMFDCNQNYLCFQGSIAIILWIMNKQSQNILDYKNEWDLIRTSYEGSVYDFVIILKWSLTLHPL